MRVAYDEISLAGLLQEHIKEYQLKVQGVNEDVCETIDDSLLQCISLSMDSFNDFITSKKFDQYLLLSELGEPLSPTKIALPPSSNVAVFLGSQLDEIRVEVFELPFIKCVRVVRTKKTAVLARLDRAARSLVEKTGSSSILPCRSRWPLPASRAPLRKERRWGCGCHPLLARRGSSSRPGV